MKYVWNSLATLGLMAITIVIAFIIGAILLAAIAGVYFVLGFIFPFINLNTLTYIIAFGIFFYMLYEPASFMLQTWRENKNV